VTSLKSWERVYRPIVCTRSEMEVSIQESLPCYCRGGTACFDERGSILHPLLLAHVEKVQSLASGMVCQSRRHAL
jgi:hypothetical protein